MKAPESYAEFLAMPDAEKEELWRTMCAGSEREPSPCHKPQSVAPTELLAVLIDLCEAIDAYQSAREELQKCEDGSLDEQEAIDFALGQWKTVLELRKAVSANPSLQGAGHLVDRTLQGVVRREDSE